MECWGPELLDHVVIQESLFELINSLAVVFGISGKLKPNEHTRGDVGALGPVIAALAFFNTGVLF